VPRKAHPLQQAFIDEGAAQFGFCLNGVILTQAVGCKQPSRLTGNFRGTRQRHIVDVPESK
jgi:aerobic-type carbon monoxide dehydrogenase small subunit (CoxS/CutS family)